MFGRYLGVAGGTKRWECTCLVGRADGLVYDVPAILVAGGGGGGQRGYCEREEAHGHGGCVVAVALLVSCGQQRRTAAKKVRVLLSISKMTQGIDCDAAVVCVLCQSYFV